MAKKKTLKVDVLTLFPEMVDAYCSASILGRAQKSGLLKVTSHNLRQWAIDKHGHVDDRPFGGGAGMLMRVEPFYAALKALHVLRPKRPTSSDRTNRTARTIRTRVVLTSAKGKMFTQKEAQRLAKYDRLVFLCGRYEGVDERVAEKLADEELSIGQYVMTGGELAALVMTDAVARLRSGVLGKEASLDEESWGDGATKEYPQYTRPEIFFAKGESASGGNKWKVPPVLLSGDHKKIAEWRRKNQA
ncbi:MAG: tRNA (guanosine(37)-N1)-methyltransferase TrmD [Patescibacteria group bacterium]|jgi:tRNA (guanine37-N1)-methyltransferase